VAKVNINAAIFGNKNPKTVRLKIGLIKGGIEADKVRIKKEVGQRR
jgi:hypothetical protein